MSQTEVRRVKLITLWVVEINDNPSNEEQTKAENERQDVLMMAKRDK